MTNESMVYGNTSVLGSLKDWMYIAWDGQHTIIALFIIQQSILNVLQKQQLIVGNPENRS